MPEKTVREELPLVGKFQLPKKKRVVRRVRRKDERLHNEHIAKQLQAHHDAHIAQLKKDHTRMLATRSAPNVYEVEINDTGGLIELPGGMVIIQDNYYVRTVDPTTGMERLFGLSPEELENYYEDVDDSSG